MKEWEPVGRRTILTRIVHEFLKLEKSKGFLTEVTETAHRDHGDVPRDVLCGLCGPVVRGYRYPITL